jgi:hypothetical protein
VSKLIELAKSIRVKQDEALERKKEAEDAGWAYKENRVFTVAYSQYEQAKQLCLII